MHAHTHTYTHTHKHTLNDMHMKRGEINAQVLHLANVSIHAEKVGKHPAGNCLAGNSLHSNLRYGTFR